MRLYRIKYETELHGEEIEEGFERVSQASRYDKCGQSKVLMLETDPLFPPGFGQVDGISGDEVEKLKYDKVGLIV